MGSRGFFNKEIEEAHQEESGWVEHTVLGEGSRIACPVSWGRWVVGDVCFLGKVGVGGCPVSRIGISTWPYFLALSHIVPR